MSKVTMQEIADALSISRISVWKALTNRPGVSDALRRQVLAKAAAMGYTAPESVPARSRGKRTFAVAVARPESSMFWMQIIHHAAKELSAHEINLMYTYMPTAGRPGYELPSSLDAGAVDGFIVLNVYDPELLGLLTESPLPRVFLDTIPSLPPDRLGGDLMMLEGRCSVCEITERLLARGCRRLGFIGDVNYAQTNTDRYNGFLDAHAAHGLTPDPSLCRIGPLGLDSHYEQIAGFLDALGELPDAFVCPSDFIAHFIRRYLTERGVQRAPLITGFDNNAEYSNVAGQITTVDVDTSALGRRLARQLMYRADYPAAPYETTYFSTRVVYRGELE